MYLYSISLLTGSNYFMSAIGCICYKQELFPLATRAIVSVPCAQVCNLFMLQLNESAYDYFFLNTFLYVS